MWETTFPPILNAIKNAGPPIYTAALVATSLLLFLPDPVIAQLGLDGVRDTYRMALGLTFVGSASLVAVHVLFALPALMKNCTP
jgi:hypothetical protein